MTHRHIFILTYIFFTNIIPIRTDISDNLLNIDANNMRVGENIRLILYNLSIIIKNI